MSYDQDIYPCAGNPGQIALTYDDGPYLYTNDLLDILAAYGFKATFFVTGVNNGKGPIDSTPAWTSVIQRMIADGHQVASHTWSHADLSKLTDADRTTEMVKNEMAIRNIIGKFPTYMRYQTPSNREKFALTIVVVKTTILVLQRCLQSHHEEPWLSYHVL